MKNRYLRFLTWVSGAILITLAVSGTALAYPSGAPSGYTGSPGDGHSCTQCHGGSAVVVSGWITSNIPSQGYTPGTIYNITMTVTGSGKKGFEVSPQNATGTQLGVLGAGSNNHLVGGTKYVTQNSAGSSSGTSTYNFTWTAPAAGTGAVTFYGAAIVGFSNTKLTTLGVIENEAIPLAANATATPAVVCAGQNAQLNVVPSGGSGTYTYSWSSIPAGFTSAIQNPVVTPAVTTQYIAHVSDGTNSVDAPTTVTVNQPATDNAGNDTTCAFITTQVPLNGDAANYSAILWTTSGTGTFTAANALTGFYLPGAADKTSGIVTLTLTALPQAPCTSPASDSRVIHFEWATGLDNPQKPGISFIISPNPSNGIFMLRGTGIQDKKATVTVNDVSGGILFTRSLDPSGLSSEQFNMSGFPKGVYLVKMQAGTESMVHKLVLE